MNTLSALTSLNLGKTYIYIYIYRYGYVCPPLPLSLSLSLSLSLFLSFSFSIPLRNRKRNSISKRYSIWLSASLSSPTVICSGNRYRLNWRPSNLLRMISLGLITFQSTSYLPMLLPSLHIHPTSLSLSLLDFQVSAYVGTSMCVCRILSG